MEQIRAPQAAPEWPSAELGIGEKRSLRKGVKSAFKLNSSLLDQGLPRGGNFRAQTENAQA